MFGGVLLRSCASFARQRPTEDMAESMRGFQLFVALFAILSSLRTREIGTVNSSHWQIGQFIALSRCRLRPTWTGRPPTSADTARGLVEVSTVRRR